MVGINSAGLFSPLSSADAGGVTPLDLSALSASPAAGTSSLSASVLYQKYEKQGDQLYAKFVDSPKLKNEIAQFKNALSSVNSVDGFFQNPKVYKFVTTALGIPDANTQGGLVKRALNSFAIDPDTYKSLKSQGLLDANGRPPNQEAQKTLIAKGYLDPQNPYRVGVANQLGAVYAKAAGLLQFSSKGVANLKDPAVIANLVQQYQQVSFEADINNQNSTVQLARYFVKTIPTILDSASTSKNVNKAVIDGILADKNLRNFVQTAFNIPKQIAVQSLTAQEKVFGNKIDVNKLTDPVYIQKVVKTFLTQADAQNSGISLSGSSKAATAASLF
ncbi:MAG: DUF1217 domain-containing protein [Candidatus Pacebacteria bacterium]|nr:DUF1217 domain-containing protein [Candidatus Paceibacterota bacterium]